MPSPRRNSGSCGANDRLAPSRRAHPFSRILAPGAAMALRVGRPSIGAATEPAPRGCHSGPISILNFGGGLVGNVRGADGLLEHRDQRVLNVGRRIRGVEEVRRGAIL